jgi:hypothetical protein
MKLFKSLLLFSNFIALSCSNNNNSTENLIRLDISPQDSIVWNEKRPCSITILNEPQQARIKYRGGFSSRYEKKSFSIEFEENVTIGNLPRDKDYILNASYIDKTFMRHILSYDLFRSFSDKNISPYSQFAEVYVKSTYIGLYIVMLESDASSLLDADDKSRSSIFKDPLIFREDIAPFIQEPTNIHQQKFPKISIMDYTADMEKLRMQILYGKQEKFDSLFLTTFDLENILDWHLLLLLSNNSDGIFKNFYLYRNNQNEPYKISPWDYDHSFGRDGDGERNMMDRPINVERSIFFQKLMKSETLSYQEKLKKKYHVLRSKNAISESSLYAMIDDYESQLSTILAKNFERWPVDGPGYYDANSFNQEIQLMKDFIKLRISQLDKMFAY